MKIVVAIKQVPDTVNIRIDPESNTLVREGVQSIVNPFDLYAIEEALRIREKLGGTVTALSMGPAQAEAALREALGLGADNAVLVSDRAFAGSDTLATGDALSCAVRALGPVDLLLMGRQAIDGDTGQVGPGVAEHLGIPHVTDVRKIELIEEAAGGRQGRMVVERLLEEGFVRLSVPLPALLTVVKEINVPRLPSLKLRLAAKKALIPTWKAADIGAETGRLGLDGSPTRVMKIFAPPRPTGGRGSAALPSTRWTHCSKRSPQTAFPCAHCKEWRWNPSPSSPNAALGAVSA